MVHLFALLVQLTLPPMPRMPRAMFSLRVPHASSRVLSIQAPRIHSCHYTDFDDGTGYGIFKGIAPWFSTKHTPTSSENRATTTPNINSYTDCASECHNFTHTPNGNPPGPYSFFTCDWYDYPNKSSSPCPGVACEYDSIRKECYLDVGHRMGRHSCATRVHPN